MNTNEKALKGKHFFPNLLGFRFWMANTIIFGHLREIMTIRNLLPLDLQKERMTHSLGFYPVLMFFTMSGFLITYQLEVEKYNTQNISIKKFYKNRIFRIWPVFYLSMFVYWILLPLLLPEYTSSIFFKTLPWLKEAASFGIYDVPKWILFLLSVFLLPHIALLIAYVNNGVWIYGVHHWTIGVEEIFYVFWPMLWKKFKNFKGFILKCFAGYYIALGISIVIYLFCRKVFHTKEAMYVSNLIFFITLFSYAYCFFIGATAIYAFLYRQDLVQKYITKGLTIFSIVVMFILMISGFEFPFFINEIFCSCFAIFMLYLVKDNKRYIIFEHPVIVYLGKITYSVYLFHFISIIVVMYVLEQLHIPQKSMILFNILQYLFTWILSFGIAALVFEKFEKKILAMR